MKNFKKLKSKKLLKELDYFETDYQYKTELMSEADPMFIEYYNNFINQHPQLKELIDKKQKEKLDAMKQKQEEIKKELEEKEKMDDSDDNNEDDKKDDIENERTDDIEEDLSDWENEEVVEKSPKLKRLYRDIVKLTHPDKIKDEDLNNIYLKATEAYEIDDLPEIYKYCDTLNIDYDIDDEDDVLFEKKINHYREKVGWLESTFTYQWYYANDEKQKENVVLNYIKNLLI